MMMMMMMMMMTVMGWRCHVHRASEGGGREIDKAKYMCFISIADNEAGL
jgi:hypothetical protein